jgi:hypothetical protein
VGDLVALTAVRMVQSAVRCFAGKLFVAILLSLCVGVYVVEMSGRWDHSIQDANDEAGVVAIVLCIGVALSAAGLVITRIRASRGMARLEFTRLTALPCSGDPLGALPVSLSSPPLRLRI